MNKQNHTSCHGLIFICYEIQGANTNTHTHAYEHTAILLSVFINERGKHRTLIMNIQYDSNYVCTSVCNTNLKMEIEGGCFWKRALKCINVCVYVCASQHTSNRIKIIVWINEEIKNKSNRSEFSEGICPRTWVK